MPTMKVLEPTADEIKWDAARLDVVLSDNIRLRCGHRGKVLAVLDLLPAGRKKHRLVAIASCMRCGATWEWGEVCAQAAKEEIDG